MKLNDIKDFIVFGKVLSAGIVIAGYAFLSVWASNWLHKNGYGLFISLSAIIIITAFGIFQGWAILKANSESRSKHSEAS